MKEFDFLKKPEWQIVKKNYISFDVERIKKMEADFWWLDDNEEVPNIVGLDEFYADCLRSFSEIAQNAGYLKLSSACNNEIMLLGEKVVFEILYDVYLFQRHESDPDIFYNYIVQLAFEAGVTIAYKWKNNSQNFEEYVDKIIRQTSMDYIEEIYQNSFGINNGKIWNKFVGSLSAPVYDMLKWYCQEEDFESYKLKLLLALFKVGTMVILDE